MFPPPITAQTCVPMFLASLISPAIDAVLAGAHQRLAGNLEKYPTIERR
jgi:hypothetical protein